MATFPGVIRSQELYRHPSDQVMPSDPVSQQDAYIPSGRGEQSESIPTGPRNMGSVYFKPKQSSLIRSMGTLSASDYANYSNRNRLNDYVGLHHETPSNLSKLRSMASLPVPIRHTTPRLGGLYSPEGAPPCNSFVDHLPREMTQERIETISLPNNAEVPNDLTLYHSEQRNEANAGAARDKVMEETFHAAAKQKGSAGVIQAPTAQPSTLPITNEFSLQDATMLRADGLKFRRGPNDETSSLRSEATASDNTAFSTSTTSSHKKSQCWVCKRLDQNFSPLFKCSTCRRRFHSHCGKPKPSEAACKENFICAHCIEKQRKEPSNLRYTQGASTLGQRSSIHNLGASRRDQTPSHDPMGTHMPSFVKGYDTEPLKFPRIEKPQSPQLTPLLQQEAMDLSEQDENNVGVDSSRNVWQLRAAMQRPWTPAEDRYLLEGVAKHGLRWNDIRADAELRLAHRNVNELRDRLYARYPEECKDPETAPRKTILLSSFEGDGGDLVQGAGRPRNEMRNGRSRPQSPIRRMSSKDSLSLSMHHYHENARSYSMHNSPPPKSGSYPPILRPRASEEELEEDVRHRAFLRSHRLAICKNITCPFWLESYCIAKTDGDCYYSHYDTGEYFPNGRAPAKQWTCFKWLHERSGCCFREVDCLYAHHDTGLYVDAQGMATQKHLSCYWWYHMRCRKPNDVCKFSHCDTGMVARDPDVTRFRIGVEVTTQQYGFPDHNSEPPHLLGAEARSTGMGGSALKPQISREAEPWKAPQFDMPKLHDKIMATTPGSQKSLRFQPAPNILSPGLQDVSTSKFGKAVGPFSNADNPPGENLHRWQQVPESQDAAKSKTGSDMMASDTDFSKESPQRQSSPAHLDRLSRVAQSADEVLNLLEGKPMSSSLPEFHDSPQAPPLKQMARRTGAKTKTSSKTAERLLDQRIRPSSQHQPVATASKVTARDEVPTNIMDPSASAEAPFGHHAESTSKTIHCNGGCRKRLFGGSSHCRKCLQKSQIVRQLSQPLSTIASQSSFVKKMCELSEMRSTSIEPSSVEGNNRRREPEVDVSISDGEMELSSSTNTNTYRTNDLTTRPFFPTSIHGQKREASNDPFDSLFVKRQKVTAPSLPTNLVGEVSHKIASLDNLVELERLRKEREEWYRDQAEKDAEIERLIKVTEELQRKHSATTTDAHRGGSPSHGHGNITSMNQYPISPAGSESLQQTPAIGLVTDSAGVQQDVARVLSESPAARSTSTVVFFDTTSDGRSFVGNNATIIADGNEASSGAANLPAESGKPVLSSRRIPCQECRTKHVKCWHSSKPNAVTPEYSSPKDSTVQNWQSVTGASSDNVVQDETLNESTACQEGRKRCLNCLHGTENAGLGHKRVSIIEKGFLDTTTFRNEVQDPTQLNPFQIRGAGTENDSSWEREAEKLACQDCRQRNEIICPHNSKTELMVEIQLQPQDTSCETSQFVTPMAESSNTGQNGLLSDAAGVCPTDDMAYITAAKAQSVAAAASVTKDFKAGPPPLPTSLPERDFGSRHDDINLSGPYLRARKFKNSQQARGDDSSNTEQDRLNSSPRNCRKAFECNRCGSSFKRKDNLTQHTKYFCGNSSKPANPHHEEIVAKPAKKTVSSKARSNGTTSRTTKPVSQRNGLRRISIETEAIFHVKSVLYGGRTVSECVLEVNKASNLVKIELEYTHAGLGPILPNISISSITTLVSGSQLSPKLKISVSNTKSSTSQVSLEMEAPHRAADLERLLRRLNQSIRFIVQDDTYLDKMFMQSQEQEELSTYPRLIRATQLSDEEVPAAIRRMEDAGIVFESGSDSDDECFEQSDTPPPRFPITVGNPLMHARSSPFLHEIDPRYLPLDEEPSPLSFDIEAKKREIASRLSRKMNQHTRNRKKGMLHQRPGTLLLQSDWLGRRRKYGSLHRNHDTGVQSQKGWTTREVMERDSLARVYGIDIEQEARKERVEVTMEEFLGLPKERAYCLMGPARLPSQQTLAFRDATVARKRITDLQKWPVGRNA